MLYIDIQLTTLNNSLRNVFSSSFDIIVRSALKLVHACLDPSNVADVLSVVIVGVKFVLS